VTGSLEPYPAYRNSGVAWLGEIPEHWEVRRNGRLFAQRNETGFANLPILEVSLKTGVRVREFASSNRKQVMTDRDKYKRAAKGDIAYNMMRMWQGAVGVAPVDGLVSPAYVVARPHAQTVTGYFGYLFRVGTYMDEVNNYSRGIVSDRNRLYWDEFKQMPSLFPSVAEQQAIVRYLDHADRRIRHYIRAKQKLIKLLEEQKQAIIHRAVTRGLDPNVRLQPSGVEWLGDVPEHWRVVALRRVTKHRCDGPFGSGLKSSHYTDGGVRVLRLQNIGLGEVRDNDAAFISEEHYASLGEHDVKCGDLLIAGLGDERTPAGRACVAPAGIEPAMVKADCFRFRLDREQIIPEFAAYHLSATACSATASLATGATRQRINLQVMSGRSMAFPPISEQEKILIDLARVLRRVEAAIDMPAREINLIREYRTRLITDVVTGKLDVRAAAAQLPDEPGALGVTEREGTEESDIADEAEEAMTADIGD